MKYLSIRVLAVFLGAMFLTAAAVADSKPQVSIHDPVMARDGDTYYLYSTGPGITFYSSEDLTNWKLGGRVFAGEPTWAKSVASTFNGHIWAPDIAYHDGTYYLYYSVSAFGRNTSAIGVTTNKTLDPQSPDYQWEDQGIVIQSVPHRDLWNAIDPNVVFDDEGTPWMSFGSFWGGMKLFKLAPNMIEPAEPQEWHTIAKLDRPMLIDDALAGPAEIEAPFIFKKDDYYYLFVSWGKCCRGAESTYRIVVGRSKDVRGPYLDESGKNMAEGGGTLVLQGNDNWAGLGHNSAYTFDGKDYLVFHAYETADNGLQKLKVLEMSWTDDGWPRVNPDDLENYVSVLESK